MSTPEATRSELDRLMEMAHREIPGDASSASIRITKKSIPNRCGDGYEIVPEIEVKWERR